MESVVTLKKLAYLTGFSVSTVSKALNGKQDISPETTNKITRIAKQHNYMPNNYAVALRKKRTSSLGVIIPHINQEFYSCILYHIQKTASSLGYRIVVFQSFDEPSSEKEHINSLNDGSVDGIVILSNKDNDSHNFDNTFVPYEYIQIKKNESFKSLKKECLKRFSFFLKSLQ